MLIDGLKFDLRIYVLLYGIDPLRIFIYEDGLGRFATDEYKAPRAANLHNEYMHLTNYAINKKSKKFTSGEDEGSGHKRSLKWVLEYLES
jgi:tubulin polyglutamylase TTLL6/13